LKEGKTPAQAQEYLKSLFHNVVSQDSSARNALQTFLAGRGDALIDYEDEAIADQKKGAAIEYVIPKDTILIQNPVAVVGSSTAGKQFVEYLLSPAGQAIWAEKGYRPVISGVPGASKFPTPPGLFTIDSLGGWKTITKQFFEPETGIVTKIEQSLGVSTAK
jgi:sulfate/thiosulfate transport system substrate-binding protein